MDGKVCIVTGANSGIGKVTATELARMGAHVVMICRSPERGENARADIVGASGSERVDLLLADLAVQSEIRRVVTEFLQRYDRLDVLVNNAGAVFDPRTVTADGIETTFATNHLNYFLLTHLLLDALKRSAPARIVNLSSRAHERAAIDFDDLQLERGYGAFKAYGQSKLANVLFTYELARRLEGTGVTANCVHPGLVRTGFGKNNSGAFGSTLGAVLRAAGIFFLNPERGARTSVHVATSPQLEGITGKYFADSRERLSAPATYDEQAARRLWAISGRMTGIAAAAPNQLG